MDRLKFGYVAYESNMDEGCINSCVMVHPAIVELGGFTEDFWNSFLSVFTESPLDKIKSFYKETYGYLHVDLSEIGVGSQIYGIKPSVEVLDSVDMSDPRCWVGVEKALPMEDFYLGVLNEPEWIEGFIKLLRSPDTIDMDWLVTTHKSFEEYFIAIQESGFGVVVEDPLKDFKKNFMETLKPFIGKKICVLESSSDGSYEVPQLVCSAETGENLANLLSDRGSCEIYPASDSVEPNKWYYPEVCREGWEFLFPDLL